MASQETRVLFRNIDEPGLASIKTYRKFGGYQSISKAYKEMTPEEVLPEKRLEDRGAAGGPRGSGDKRISRHPVNKGTRPKGKK